MIFLNHGFGGLNNKISFTENILFVCWLKCVHSSSKSHAIRFKSWACAHQIPVLSEFRRCMWSGCHLLEPEFELLWGNWVVWVVFIVWKDWSLVSFWGFLVGGHFVYFKIIYLMKEFKFWQLFLIELFLTKNIKKLKKYRKSLESIFLWEDFIWAFLDVFSKNCNLQRILIFSLCTVHFGHDVPILLPNEIFLDVGHVSYF